MKKLFTVIGITIALFLFTGMASALNVTLQWDSNTDYDLAGYFVHYSSQAGAPGTNYNGVGALEGDSPIRVLLTRDENPDPEISEFTLHDLVDTKTRFVVTAYDTSELVSGFSNQVNTSVSVPNDLRISFIERMAALFDRLRDKLASKQNKGKGQPHQL